MADENKNEVKQDTVVTTPPKTPGSPLLTLEELIDKSEHEIKIIAGAFTELGLTRVFNEEAKKLINPIFRIRNPSKPVLSLKDLEDAVQTFLKKS